MDKRKHISISAVVEYWRNNCPLSEHDLNFDWCDASCLCWGCGRERKIQKCHIVPRAIGGPDSPENTVLLCKFCHESSPDVFDENFMWEWIADQKRVLGTSITYNLFSDLKDLCGQLLEQGLSPEEGAELLKSLQTQVSSHSGKFSESTWKWIFREVSSKAERLKR